MHAAFLQDIREHPDDDAPRLVYSDWLADNGDEARGEFIRAQCRGDHAGASALLVLHEPAWRAGLPKIDGIHWGAFTRGFVEGVTAKTTRAYLFNAEAIFAAAPVHRLRILEASRGIEQLAASPHLLALSELNLGNRSGVTAAGVRELAWSPNAGSLTSLLLHQNNLGDAGLMPLAFSPHTRGMRELYVSGVGVGDSGAGALASGHLAHLDLLDLRDNNIGDVGAMAMFNWPGQGPITLQLSNNRIGTRGGEALANTPNLQSLERLHLDHNPVGDRTALALARAPHRHALRELDLRGCGITDEGALAVANSPLARQLQEVCLMGNPIRRRETLQTLADRFGRRLHA